MDLLVLIAQLIAFILAFVVVIVLVVIIQFFVPRGKRSKVRIPEREEGSPPPPKQKLKLWEKHPPIETFEFLYWQGVYETWRYNVFAPDLIKYAQEHLPLRHLEFKLYNSNKNGSDYKTYTSRIEKLRPRKTVNFPLVVINYDQELISIESTRDFEDMKARIDSEWDRYYGLV